MNDRKRNSVHYFGTPLSLPLGRQFRNTQENMQIRPLPVSETESQFLSKRIDEDQEERERERRRRRSCRYTPAAPIHYAGPPSCTAPLKKVSSVEGKPLRRLYSPWSRPFLGSCLYSPGCRGPRSSSRTSRGSQPARPFFAAIQRSRGGSKGRVGCIF